MVTICLGRRVVSESSLRGRPLAAGVCPLAAGVCPLVASVCPLAASVCPLAAFDATCCPPSTRDFTKLIVLLRREISLEYEIGKK